MQTDPRALWRILRRAFVRGDRQTLDYHPLPWERRVFLTDPRMRAALRRRKEQQPCR